MNEYFGCFRNDSLTQQVKIIPNNSAIEGVLYDFDVVVGDTIFDVSYCTDQTADWQSGDFRILGIDSILVGLEYYKRIRIHRIGSVGNSDSYWYDHFGTMEGLLGTLSEGSVSVYRLTA